MLRLIAAAPLFSLCLFKAELLTLQHFRLGPF